MSTKRRCVAGAITPPRRGHPARDTAVGAAIVAAVLLLATGCGGSDGRPASAGPDVGHEDAADQGDAAVQGDTGGDVSAADDASGAPDATVSSDVTGDVLRSDAGLDVDEEEPTHACPEGDFVLVPAGPFLFGPFDEPAETDAYCLQRDEVTAAEYAACVDDGGCEGFSDWTKCVEQTDDAPNQCRGGRGAFPANWLDWYRAEAFCRWSGLRLPTEREWEKAARGPAGLRYPWGDELSCTEGHHSRGETYNACVGVGGLPDAIVPVGTYDDAESPYGAVDLVGNVMEWIDHRQPGEAVPDPDRPGVAKGGDWRSGDDFIAAWASERRLGPGLTSEGHGVRCAVDAVALDNGAAGP